MTAKISSLLNDEESMRQIKELTEMFGGKGTAQENSPPEADIGINPIMLMGLMEAFTKQDSACELIMALRPHLSEDKQLKADRAVKMLKLYNVYLTLKENGMLNDFQL